MITRYYTTGSRDLPEGLTTGVYQTDNDGNIVSGIDQGFMFEEVTEAEYNAIQQEFNNGGTPLGLALGLVSATGQAAIAAKFQKLDNRKDLQIAGQSALGRYGTDQEFKDAINVRAEYLKAQIGSMGITGALIDQHLMSEPRLIKEATKAIL